MYIIDFEKTYTYDEIINSCIKLKHAFEPILQLKSIGVSHDNREIIQLTLGLGQKRIICLAGVHARETINPIVLLRIIQEYASSYYRYKSINGIDIRSLLNEYSIVFVPLLNPDGYMIALHGYQSIRNVQLRQQCLLKKVEYYEWKYNARGVDLNRNFCSQSFRPSTEVPFSLSEKESIALANLFAQCQSEAFLDFHSRGESIFYYRNTMNAGYNKKQLILAKAIQKGCGYILEKPEEEIPDNDSGGNTVHYYSEKYRKPAITIETVKEEEQCPLQNKLRDEVFKQIIAIPIIVLTTL